MIAVAVNSLSVRAGEKRLIDGISFDAPQGQTIALVGPNGAGKSTLLRALAGELAFGEGTILLKGRAIHDWPSHELARHRAVLSQNITVTFPFTVAEIVKMGAGGRMGRDIDTMADAALADVDLNGFRDRIIGTLSGGEQQRVHFARVMVQLACGEQAHGPGILLLDEPTASLDLRHQLDLVAAAKKAASGGTTVIAIVHDLNLAALMADRVIVMGRGRIAADGRPSVTINEQIIGKVFGVSDAINRIPPDSQPFVLPHLAQKI